MTDPSATLVRSTLPFRRRRLLQLGVAGAAATWLGPLGGLGEVELAEASTLRPELRRSVWLEVTDPAFSTAIDERRVAALRLLEVADLPIAEQLPALREHDAAFVVRFAGAPGIPQGTRTLTHAELGTIELFVVPVGSGGDGLYEAVVDRTIRIAGVNEEDVPKVVVPDVRAQQPAPANPGAGGVASPAKPPKPPKVVVPRVRRIELARPVNGPNRRTLVATLALADARQVKVVRGQLLRGGRVVARATGTRRGQTARLRFTARRPLARGRYELALTLISDTGHVTRLRRRIRFT